MNVQTDWDRWGSTWRERPKVDPQRLYRQVRRKRATTCVAITVKALLTSIMVVVLGYQALEPATGLIWKLWFALILVVLLTSTAAAVWMLRGTWRVASQSVPDMLRYTIRRAQAGIRLSWIGTALFVLVVALTVCMNTWWELSPMWTRGVRPDLLSPIPLAAGAVTAAIAFAWKFMAVARLKRKLHEAEAWLREYT